MDVAQHLYMTSTFSMLYTIFNVEVRFMNTENLRNKPTEKQAPSGILGSHATCKIEDTCKHLHIAQVFIKGLGRSEMCLPITRTSPQQKQRPPPTPHAPWDDSKVSASQWHPPALMKRNPLLTSPHPQRTPIELPALNPSKLLALCFVHPNPQSSANAQAWNHAQEDMHPKEDTFPSLKPLSKMQCQALLG